MLKVFGKEKPLTTAQIEEGKQGRLHAFAYMAGLPDRDLLGHGEDEDDEEKELDWPERDQIIEGLEAKLKAAEQKAEDMEVENSELQGQLTEKDEAVLQAHKMLQTAAEKERRLEAGFSEKQRLQREIFERRMVRQERRFRSIHRMT